MANFWENDPVVVAPENGGNFWENDPIVEQKAADPTVTSGFSDMTNAGVQGFVEGIPVLGPLLRKGSEYASAGARSLIRGEEFDDALSTVQSHRSGMAERNPGMTLAGNIAGGVAGTAPLVAMAPVLMGAQGASTAGRMAYGAGSGAALGGTDAAVRSGGDLGGAAFGAGAGVILGGAAPAIGKAVGAGVEAASDALGMRAAGKAARATSPSIEALGEQASALYKAAGDAGVSVKPVAYRFFLGGLSRELKSKGFDRSLHPRAKAALGRLVENVDQPKSLEELEILRRVVGSAASSMDASERKVAGTIKDFLDEWLERLPNDAFNAGNPRVGIPALREARSVWGQMRRGEEIARAVERAQLSASGYEAGLRNEFRSLAKNDKKMRGFSDPEKRAIRAVASGTSFGNAMKWMGKAAPSGIVSTGISAALGAAIGGPVGAAALPAAGYLARSTADAVTRRGAETASALARQSRVEQAARPALGRVDREAIDRRTQAGLVGLLPAINP